MRSLRTITVTPHVTPLREGGSLPAIIQPSPVRTGTTADPAACLEHLMERIVKR